MGVMDRGGTSHAIAHALRLLEAGWLGRAHVDAHAALMRARAVGSDRDWCMRCGVSIGDQGQTRVRCPIGEGPCCAACRSRPLFDAFIRLGRYDSPLGALVRQVKARAWHAAAEAIGAGLGDEVHARLFRPSGGWRVVPVPGSFVRRLTRGIDHARAIAASCARQLDAPLIDALASRFGVRQASLDRRERLQRRRMRPRRGEMGCPGLRSAAGG